MRVGGNAVWEPSENHMQVSAAAQWSLTFLGRFFIMKLCVYLFLTEVLQHPFIQLQKTYGPLANMSVNCCVQRIVLRYTNRLSCTHSSLVSHSAFGYHLAQFLTPPPTNHCPPRCCQLSWEIPVFWLCISSISIEPVWVTSFSMTRQEKVTGDVGGVDPWGENKSVNCRIVWWWTSVIPSCGHTLMDGGEFVSHCVGQETSTPASFYFITKNLKKWWGRTIRVREIDREATVSNLALWEFFSWHRPVKIVQAQTDSPHTLTTPPPHTHTQQDWLLWLWKETEDGTSFRFCYLDSESLGDKASTFTDLAE